LKDIIYLVMRLFLCLTVIPALATSAQMEMTERTLLLEDGEVVHGTAFFGAVIGSDLYNSAGNLGATFHLGSWKPGILYFNGDVWTWIENGADNSFKPRRILYTLEPGYYRQKGNDAYRFFIKHQSYHNVDFFGGMNEAYELYGVSYRHLDKPKVYLELGTYQNKRIVDYSLDIAASLTLDLPPWNDRATYLEIWGHHVTETGSTRNGFTDYAAELGFAYRNGITLFGRYEYLHDINHFDGIADHHVLTGIRYRW
jgi:hypothetical protein